MTQPGHRDFMNYKLSKYANLGYSQILTNKNLLPQEKEYLISKIPPQNRGLTGNRLFIKRTEPEKESSFFGSNSFETFMNEKLEKIGKEELIIGLCLTSLLLIILFFALIFKK